MAENKMLSLSIDAQAMVMSLYVRSKAVPPVVLVLLCLSKRLHSIFVLRMFNDGVAMMLAYAAISLLTLRRWRTSILAFSAAVSVKMNVLLMAPGVLIVLLKVSSNPFLPIPAAYLQLRCKQNHGLLWPAR